MRHTPPASRSLNTPYQFDESSPKMLWANPWRNPHGVQARMEGVVQRTRQPMRVKQLPFFTERDTDRAYLSPRMAIVYSEKRLCRSQNVAILAVETQIGNAATNILHFIANTD